MHRRVRTPSDFRASHTISDMHLRDSQRTLTNTLSWIYERGCVTPSVVRSYLLRARTTKSIVLGLLTALLLIAGLHTNLNKSKVVKPFDTLPYAQASEFPRKIWQTWQDPPQTLREELRRCSRSWIDMNPDYKYELLTDNAALTYVREKYSNRPGLIHTFENTRESLLRNDLLRYLLLFAEGGFYADIDTSCFGPIDDWITAEHARRASFIVGIEYDAQSQKPWPDFSLPIQLCQWTFMSRPGSKVLEHVVDRVVGAVHEVNVYNEAATRLEMLDSTGPYVRPLLIACLISDVLLTKYARSSPGRSSSTYNPSGRTSPSMTSAILLSRNSSVTS